MGVQLEQRPGSGGSRLVPCRTLAGAGLYRRHVRLQVEIDQGGADHVEGGVDLIYLPGRDPVGQRFAVRGLGRGEAFVKGEQRAPADTAQYLLILRGLHHGGGAGVAQSNYAPTVRR